ncbi:hypothetical protein NX794_07010 [Streptomyces sp. LP11]|uniref:Secreted protein n=1 Tax=Streptomyces pyxinicus TaxID=2970331 RepID=A0ABT2AXL3_9ACTN|nr:hypothetical protein [Streptomyces sp. LP11]MCS0600981.1 hypothetical protein [Streptomyces sp. LP11]
MPRGRHRHSPPLHRLLPPSAIAGVSVVCALGPWAFSEATVVRALAAVAAATAVAGAVVMRRWDTQAGKQVAELTRARAGDEWRHEERVAELETDLEESRELRAKLEQRLRAKRAELAGLRNEHAALLRRYATAETERASALEGRRLLEIEAAVPSSSPALPPARGDERGAAEAAPEDPDAAGDADATGDSDGGTASGAVFSAEGSWLYRRALTALARFDGDAVTARTGARDHPDAGPGDAQESDAQEGEEQGQPEAADAHARAVADTTADETVAPTELAESAEPAEPAEPARAAEQRPGGHFTVPTAVAVVPATPARRPGVEGGFDFFGTQKDAPTAALDSVQNEDLADVVGQEALAVHKAEAEAGFKPADASSDGAGQVIDLTEHDETEHIDVQGLRSAAS